MTRAEAKSLALSKCVHPFRGKVIDALAQASLMIQAEYARMADERLAGILASVMELVPDARVMRAHDEIIMEMPVPLNRVEINALVTQHGIQIQAPQSRPLVSPG